MAFSSGLAPGIQFFRHYLLSQISNAGSLSSFLVPLAAGDVVTVGALSAPAMLLAEQH